MFSNYFYSFSRYSILVISQNIKVPVLYAVDFSEIFKVAVIYQKGEWLINAINQRGDGMDFLFTEYQRENVAFSKLTKYSKESLEI